MSEENDESTAPTTPHRPSSNLLALTHKPASHHAAAVILPFLSLEMVVVACLDQ